MSTSSRKHHRDTRGQDKRRKEQEPPVDRVPPIPPEDQAGRHAKSIAVFLISMIAMLALDLIVKDQAFKHVAGTPVKLAFETASDPDVHPVPDHESVNVIPSVLSLHLTVNRGAVFGIGQGKRWVFMLISVLAVAAIGWFFSKSHRQAWGTHLCLGFILSGALGNLYDRLIYGAVRDMFLLFPGVKLPFGWHWPNGSSDLYPWIFNVADVALLVGVCMLIIGMWRADRKAARALSDQKDDQASDAAKP